MNEIILSDGARWQIGMKVYYFELFFSPIDIKARMFSEVPSGVHYGEGWYRFYLECGVFYRHEYYSTYEAALIALAQVMKESYAIHMKQALENMRQLKQAANSNAKELVFSYNGEVNQFNSDEIEILRDNQ